MNGTQRLVEIGVALMVSLTCLSVARAGTPQEAKTTKMIGMYVHQHWPYKRPYAARTWTVEDWRGYAGGLKQLGFNAVLIWPMIETMPNPLTPSDRANLDKLGKVVEMLHAEHQMKVYFVVCPNIVARNDEAKKATFQNRHYYYCEDLVNPKDAAAVERLVNWREKLLTPLKNADGIAIIDSDPGGYPGSSIEEFVNLLGAHRRMLDRLRPGIELIYWVHAGWRGWGRLYEKGKLDLGKPEEYQETFRRVMELNPEPWGLANGLNWAKEMGIANKVISFNYGRIEGEPSFPMTNFTGQNAYEGASSDAPRGVMGNAQTHCVQLPNTFAFARGAQGLPLTDADYIQFGNDLIPGQGETIFQAWRLLNADQPNAQREMAATLDRIGRGAPSAGRLGGLLFGSPRRFLNDLALMLRYKASLQEWSVAADSGKGATQALRQFIKDASAWQTKHGYKNNWYDPKFHAALRKLNSTHITNALAVTYEIQRTLQPGEWAFEDIRRNFAQIETYTPRLMDAMKKTLQEREAGGLP